MNDDNSRYRCLALEIIAKATADGVTEFRRLQLLGELGGLIAHLADRADWLLSQWEQTTADLDALKAKVTP